MTKRSLWLAGSILLIILMTSLHAKRTFSQNSGWHATDVRFSPLSVGNLYQIDPTGRYIFEYDGLLLFEDTTDLTGEKVAQTRGDASRWLNGTILYKEFSWRGFAAPNCPDSGLLPIARYVARNRTQQLYCLNAPQISILDRYPYDDYVLFGDNRYLINLRTNTVNDLQLQLSSQVAVADTLNWTASNHIWWDVRTQMPMAMVTYSAEPVPFGTDAQEMLQLCPMTATNCQALIDVQNYVHGNLADFALSPDGRTLLWSAFQIRSTATILTGPPGIGVVEDLIAFATDIQTGNTTEIFRLSQHNTTSAKGVSAHWSADGKTLAIRMQTYDTSSSVNTTDDGLMMVSFNGPSIPTPTFIPTNTATPTPTNTPTPSSTPTPTPTPTLRLQYYPDPSTVGTTVDGIMPDFNIVNSSKRLQPEQRLLVPGQERGVRRLEQDHVVSQRGASLGHSPS